MSVNTTIAVLYAQTGLGTQFAHTAAVTPHAQAAMSRVLALETAKQEQQTVEKSSKSENKGIAKDGHNKNEANFAGQRGERQEPDDVFDENDIFCTDPYSGNLLNVKI
ncbi:MAG: hypothetical protein IJS54_03620 [Desulfovibrio sp.]|nr:hypothetical protein [Desulfovibrio sp.]